MLFLHPAPRRQTALTLLIASLAPASALTQQNPDADPPSAFERLTVMGSRPAEQSGGSASYVSSEELERFNHTDVHRALRQVPGVYVVDEEGYGLRPNIGLRGSGTDRSSRITLTEDGVLIAPAPYAAPAAYYFPTMQRMSAVEVRKGSAAVRSGPRTTGGAINFLSTPIPEGPLSGSASLQAGEDQTLLGRIAVGGAGERLGYVVEAVRQDTDGFKRIDGGGNSGYELDDLLAKLRYTTPGGSVLHQEIELKVGIADQLSNETYMGLTYDDFELDPDRRYSSSRLDNIRTDHDQIELRHYVSFGSRVDLTTAVYRNEFARNWYKVDRLSTASMSAVLEDPVTFATEYGWLTGTTSPDNSIILRNNNRRYQARGLQTIVGFTPMGAGGVGHDLEIGIRYHEDEEDRLQDDDRYRMQDGSLVLTTDGAAGSQDNRVGSAEALSLYIHDEISFGDFVLTPGVRHESVDLEQRRWAGTDPTRVGVPISVTPTDFDETIAGVGAVYELGEAWRLLGGIHQGFNAPAPASNAAAEESLNYEAGARFRRNAASAEIIAFYNDYDNLVGTCTASTGGSCEIGDQFAGGKVRMLGLELSSRYDFSLESGLTVPVQLVYTYTDAEFRTSFSSSFEEWGQVEAGDELPYLPEHLAQLQVGLADLRWGVHLAATFTDAMRIEAGQGEPGPTGATDRHWVFDVAGDWELSDSLSIFARLENALDETYVVAWRPAGARPGLPRTALVGINARF